MEQNFCLTENVCNHFPVCQKGQLNFAEGSLSGKCQSLFKERQI